MLSLLILDEKFIQKCLNLFIIVTNDILNTLGLSFAAANSDGAAAYAAGAAAYMRQYENKANQSS
jgi:hypothetical protein